MKWMVAACVAASLATPVAARPAWMNGDKTDVCAHFAFIAGVVNQAVRQGYTPRLLREKLLPLETQACGADTRCRTLVITGYMLAEAAGVVDNAVGAKPEETVIGFYSGCMEGDD